MPLFVREDKVVYPEPLRGVLIAGYAKSKGRDVSCVYPEFFMTSEGVKVPLFPIYLPVEKDDVSLDGIFLSALMERTMSDEEDYIRIAIGEDVRITWYGIEELFEKELEREAPSLVPVWKKAREISEDYHCGRKSSAKKKWEDLQGYLRGMDKNTQAMVRAVFCSHCFITHRVEQKDPLSDHHSFVFYYSAVKKVIDPERFASRLISLYRFERLNEEKKTNIHFPWNMKLNGINFKNLYLVRGERAWFPSEMNGAVVFYHHPSGHPIYFEACPFLSSEEMLVILAFSHSSISEKEIAEALFLLSPSFKDRNPEVKKLGEYRFITVDEFKTKDYRLLLPPQFAYISKEVKDVYNISLL